MTGAVVTDLDLCQAPNDANICPDDSDLGGVYANNTSTDCDIFATCLADSPLGISLNLTAGGSVEVADEQLCDLSVPGVEMCTEGPMTGAVVTDPTLCQAPNDANICGEGEDLEGVFVNNTATDCTVDVSLTDNAEAQCIKCGDLAVFSATGSPSNTGNNFAAVVSSAAELRGSPATTPTNTNIFTVCDDPTTARADFDTRVTNTAVVTAFNACLDSAEATNPPSLSLVPGQAASLQENSFTTNVKPEAEIPSVNTESQNPDLNSLLENPHLKALLENPELNAMLDNADPNVLLENPDVKALLQDPEVNALLENQEPKVKALPEDSKVTAQLKNPTTSSLTGLFP
jgi:hypothetical protein